jgi:hypothetical protein
MISDENRKRVIEKMSAYLVERLMSEKNLSRDIAGETLKKSLLYEMLLDSETDMYLESRESLWEYLTDEMNGHPENLLIF